MARPSKHNWRNLYLEYNQGRYRNLAEFAEKRDINYDRIRKEFKKLEKEAADQKPGKTGQNDRAKPGKKIRNEEPVKSHPWEALKKQFLDWPEEKLQAYVVQIEERLAELNIVPYEELTSEEKKELGRLRRERRAILSKPDPEKICKVIRNGKKCNNPVERGKEVCWNHGGAPGSGPPRGSKNALKTGEHETIWLDALDDDERVLLSKIDTGLIQQADETIQLLTIRERRMLKRIKDLMDGLTEKQRRVLQERRTVKEAITVHDEKTGQTKVVTIPRDELVVAEIEETEYRAIDDIMNLEEALTRVQDKKIKAIKAKYELLGDAERQVRIEKMKLEVEKLRGNGPGEGDAWADLMAGDDDDESEES